MNILNKTFVLNDQQDPGVHQLALLSRVSRLGCIVLIVQRFVSLSFPFLFRNRKANSEGMSLNDLSGYVACNWKGRAVNIDQEPHYASCAISLINWPISPYRKRVWFIY